MMQTLPHLHLTPWLGDLFLQTTLVLGLMLIASMSLWRMSAAKRHTLLAISLFSMPLLMLGSYAPPRWSWRSKNPAAVSSMVASPISISTISASPKPLDASPLLVRQETLSKSSASDLSWIALVWLLGTTISLCSLLIAVYHLHRLRRQSLPFDDERLLAFASAQPHIAVRVSQQFIMPMTWGLWHPIILLPADAKSWSDERLHLVLQHELAHIQRRDAITHFCCSLSACLLWFHPLVWIAQRRLAHLREIACDDHVLRSSRDVPSHATYAEQLLQTITALQSSGHARALAPALAIGIASRAARQLKARLASILNERVDRSVFTSRHCWSLTGGFILAILLVSGLSACREKSAKASSKPLRDRRQVTLSCRVLEVPTTPESLSLFTNGDSSNQFAVRGVLTKEQGEALIQKIASNKSINLCASPTVTTRNGQKATVETVREFIYPTEFEPAKLNDKGDVKKVPVIPATPTHFDMTQVGLRIEFKPTIGEDGIIDLDIAPHITDFEGFINYGVPIHGVASSDAALDKQPGPLVLTENRICQPIFSTVTCEVSLSIHDGAFIIFGGNANPHPHAGSMINSSKLNLKDVEPTELPNWRQSKAATFFLIQANVINGQVASAK